MDAYRLSLMLMRHSLIRWGKPSCEENSTSIFQGSPFGFHLNEGHAEFAALGFVDGQRISELQRRCPFIAEITPSKTKLEKTSESDFAAIDFPAFFGVDLSGSMAAPS